MDADERGEIDVEIRLKSAREAKSMSKSASNPQPPPRPPPIEIPPADAAQLQIGLQVTQRMDARPRALVPLSALP